MAIKTNLIILFLLASTQLFGQDRYFSYSNRSYYTLGLRYFYSVLKVDSLSNYEIMAASFRRKVPSKAEFSEHDKTWFMSFDGCLLAVDGKKNNYESAAIDEIGKVIHLKGRKIVMQDIESGICYRMRRCSERYYLKFKNLEASVE